MLNSLALTLFILGISDAVQANWITVVVTIIGLIVGFVFAKRVRAVRRFLDILSLKMPVFGGLNQKVAVSRSHGPLLPCSVQVCLFLVH